MELANSASTYSNVQWVVARIQPEVNGLDDYRCGEHWEDHGFHFNEQYHPQCFDSFWRKDIPEGHFIDECGIINIAKEKIAQGLEYETYSRKYYYYLNFWEMWGFRLDEFGICVEGTKTVYTIAISKFVMSRKPRVSSRNVSKKGNDSHFHTMTNRKMSIGNFELQIVGN